MNIRHALALATLAAASTLTGCATVHQESFDSPEAAVNAMILAVRPEYDEVRLEEVLGPGVKSALTSGDKAADRNAVSTFLARYDRGHQFAAPDDSTRILEIDTDHWPFAFPLYRDDTGRWWFDTAAGINEIICRRVGANELDTIQTLLALVDAQRDYALLDPNNDGVHDYAQSFRSSRGKRDGLYWPTGPGEPQSPIGEIVADALARGYTAESNVYLGYRYRMLTSERDPETGNTWSCLAGGYLLGGFGIVAWPAEYGNSGVMSFITNQDGVVYQKDLGARTGSIGSSMKVFDPEGWAPVGADVTLNP